MSRFFGGVPLADVPRSEVPAESWNGAPAVTTSLAAAAWWPSTCWPVRGGASLDLASPLGHTDVL
jgi:hypothetical protein